MLTALTTWTLNTSLDRPIKVFELYRQRPVFSILDSEERSAVTAADVVLVCEGWHLAPGLTTNRPAPKGLSRASKTGLFQRLSALILCWYSETGLNCRLRLGKPAS